MFIGLVRGSEGHGKASLLGLREDAVVIKSQIISVRGKDIAQLGVCLVNELKAAPRRRERQKPCVDDLLVHVVVFHIANAYLIKVKQAVDHVAVCILTLNYDLKLLVVAVRHLESVLEVKSVGKRAVVDSFLDRAADGKRVREMHVNTVIEHVVHVFRVIREYQCKIYRISAGGDVNGLIVGNYSRENPRSAALGYENCISERALASRRDVKNCGSRDIGGKVYCRICVRDCYRLAQHIAGVIVAYPERVLTRGRVKRERAALVGRSYLFIIKGGLNVNVRIRKNYVIIRRIECYGVERVRTAEFLRLGLVSRYVEEHIFSNIEKIYRIPVVNSVRQEKRSLVRISESERITLLTSQINEPLFDRAVTLVISIFLLDQRVKGVVERDCRAGNIYKDERIIFEIKSVSSVGIARNEIAVKGFLKPKLRICLYVTVEHISLAQRDSVQRTVIAIPGQIGIINYQIIYLSLVRLLAIAEEYGDLLVFGIAKIVICISENYRMRIVNN